MRIFAKIGEDMSGLDAPAIKNKYDTMYKRYRREKDACSKTRAAPSSWRWFEDMDALAGSRPINLPITTKPDNMQKLASAALEKGKRHSAKKVHDHDGLHQPSLVFFGDQVILMFSRPVLMSTIVQPDPSQELDSPEMETPAPPLRIKERGKAASASQPPSGDDTDPLSDLPTAKKMKPVERMLLAVMKRYVRGCRSVYTPSMQHHRPYQPFVHDKRVVTRGGSCQPLGNMMRPTCFGVLQR